jgi:hypothetical protein
VLAPGRTASHALNSSSTVRPPPHRPHPADPARAAQSGHRTATRSEIIAIPPRAASSAPSNSVMNPSPSSSAAPRASSETSDPESRESITPGAAGRADRAAALVPVAASEHAAVAAGGFDVPRRRSYAARATGSASTLYAADKT